MKTETNKNSAKSKHLKENKFWTETSKLILETNWN